MCSQKPSSSRCEKRRDKGAIRLDRMYYEKKGQKKTVDISYAPLCSKAISKAKCKRDSISNYDILEKDTNSTLLKEYSERRKRRLNNVKNGNEEIARMGYIS